MNKKVVVLGILAVCLSISIGIGFSYAVWTQTEKQTGTNTFESGCFSISLGNENKAINIPNGYPISDEKGIQQEAYTFTITNTCSIYAHFSVNLEKLAISDMEDQYIKLQLNNRRPMLYNAYNQVTATTSGNTSRSLDFGGLEPEAERTYSLRLWIDNEATNDQVGGKSFQALISVVSAAAEPTGAEYIENLLATNTETMANDDPDENVRYIGANPNNYVNFNDELWRIIGVFYVKSSEEGPYEKRLKIIRNDGLPVALAWDSNNVNDWSKASLKLLLNEDDYWQRIGEYKEIGLTDSAKNMIANVMWNLGGLDGGPEILTKAYYISERGTTVYNGRPTIWIGKVGLMYPSDYGYATGGNALKNRAECLSKDLFYWGDKLECAQNSWLLNVSHHKWTMTPCSFNGAFFVATDGNVRRPQVSETDGVWPVVYLKSDVNIIHDANHDGSENKPYELSI